MNIDQITNFGQLKAAGYEYKSVKDELRQNLLQKIKDKETTFDGIHGYEYTVVPE